MSDTTTKKRKTTKTSSTKKTATKKTTRRSPSKSLVIVESPAKARTIERYLGKKYSVKASMGHVRDLPKSKMGVDVHGDFEPQYLIPRDKNKVVKELRESVKNAKEILLATDPDREGEAIAWHLIEAAQAGDKPVHRVVFHEITSNAVQEAIENPRDIDMRLVEAQQARRVLDRLVGYEISPLLWKKVKRGLSAGRVQSVALRMIVEREEEIREFEAEEYWTIEAKLQQQASGNGKNEPKSFTASLHRVNGDKPNLSNEELTMTIVKDLDGAEYTVTEVRTKETQRRPAPPFTTSTLQQEASRKLRMGTGRTMSIAQELYQGVDLGSEGATGLITYMRTDSTNVASVAQQRAREVLEHRFGKEYLPEKPPVYARKSKGAQEAHEAIRPTDPARTPESVRPFLSQPQYRLYRLIWQRFMASQTRNAIFDSTSVDIHAGKPGGEKPYLFRATGSVIKFAGFIDIYREDRDDGEEDEMDRDALPQLTQDELLALQQLLPEQHFTQPPPRYSEATLVKALEEQGIGRPSTYAPTIQTLKGRYYVNEEERRLFPTELGEIVNRLLKEHFPKIVDYDFTSEMEDELDEIATGERKWVPVIREFYQGFHPDVEKAEANMEKVQIKDEPVVFWTVEAEFDLGTGDGRSEPVSVTAQLSRVGNKSPEFAEESKARAVADELKNSSFIVERVEVETERRANILRPFTRDDLLRDAEEHLGFNNVKTVTLADQLHEGVNANGAGAISLISDINSKSSNIPQPDWQNVAKLIDTNYGAACLPDGVEDLAAGASADETLAGVVVPADPDRTPENVRSYLTGDQFQLYDLIWRRFLAIQAADAILERVKVTLRVDGSRDNNAYLFSIQAGMAEKTGFLEIYPEIATDVRADNTLCKALQQLGEGEILRPTSVSPVKRFELCEKCGRPMVIKLGRFGKFVACSGFPDCRNSKPLLVKVGVDCPECGQGEIVERRSKKGRPFYGCSRYPECEFISWNKPVGRQCPECGDILVEAGRRGAVKCRSCSYKESGAKAKAS
jgi:DNA topoisomerase I